MGKIIEECEGKDSFEIRKESNRVGKIRASIRDFLEAWLLTFGLVLFYAIWKISRVIDEIGGSTPIPGYDGWNCNIKSIYKRTRAEQKARLHSETLDKREPQE
jgi:hypothetical protein